MLEKTKVYDAIYITYDKLSVNHLVSAVEKLGIDKDEDMIVLKEALALQVEKKQKEFALDEETCANIKKEIEALPDCPEYKNPKATLPFDIW